MVAMPKAAVDEDSDASRREDDVRFSWQQYRMESVAETYTMQHFP